MASRTKYIREIAGIIRPDVFKWTKANYDRKAASGRSWTMIENEQQRWLNAVYNMLMATEKIGLRIFDPNEVVTEGNVAVFDTIKPFFPSLEVHKKFRNKFFKRHYNRKGARLERDEEFEE